MVDGFHEGLYLFLLLTKPAYLLHDPHLIVTRLGYCWFILPSFTILLCRKWVDDARAFSRDSNQSCVEASKLNEEACGILKVGSGPVEDVGGSRWSPLYVGAGWYPREAGGSR